MTLPAYQMLIDGKLVESQSRLTVINPANEAPIATAPNCSSAQLDQAVAAARAALPAWRSLSEDERAGMLKAAAAVIGENGDLLMRLLTNEQGKPHAQAQIEVMGAAYWMGAVADLRLPVLVNEDGPERRSETRYVPLGVVGAISPWNFPVMLSIWKVAPALMAGNTIVLKPSPFTPLAVLKVGELLKDAFPPGVLNIVTGGDALGPMMTAHPGIDKVSFTGSTATGKQVMRSASNDLKRVTLELGGNDAAIVMPDVDVATVAQDLFWAAFRNTGQICIATKRMYVHADVYDALADALVSYAKTLTIGDGSQQGTDLGPLQNRLQFDRVRDLIADCASNDMNFLIGGEVDGEGKGYFVPITIVDNPPEKSRVVCEEAFGPVLPLLKFSDVDEVVARANDSEYGLAASIWSRDTRQALEIAARIEAGTVWINEVQHLTPFQPFAGHKQSGAGVENGIDGLLEYAIPKTITVKASPTAERRGSISD